MRQFMRENVQPFREFYRAFVYALKRVGPAQTVALCSIGLHIGPARAQMLYLAAKASGTTREKLIDKMFQDFVAQRHLRNKARRSTFVN